MRLRALPSGRRSPGAPWRSRRPRKCAPRQLFFQSLDLLATAATSGGELLLEAGDLGAARRRRGALGVERRLQRRRLVARGRRRLLRDDPRRVRVQRRLLGRGDAFARVGAPDAEAAGAARAAASASSSCLACRRRSFRSLAACASSSRAAASVASPSLSAASACVARSSRSRTARFSSLRSAFRALELGLHVWLERALFRYNTLRAFR